MFLLIKIIPNYFDSALFLKIFPPNFKCCMNKSMNIIKRLLKMRPIFREELQYQSDQSIQSTRSSMREEPNDQRMTLLQQWQDINRELVQKRRKISQTIKLHKRERRFLSVELMFYCENSQLQNLLFLVEAHDELKTAFFESEVLGRKQIFNFNKRGKVILPNLGKYMLKIPADQQILNVETNCLTFEEGEGNSYTLIFLPGSNNVNSKLNITCLRAKKNAPKNGFFFKSYLKIYFQNLSWIKHSAMDCQLELYFEKIDLRDIKFTYNKTLGKYTCKNELRFAVYNFSQPIMGSLWRRCKVLKKYQKIGEFSFYPCQLMKSLDVKTYIPIFSGQKVIAKLSLNVIYFPEHEKIVQKENELMEEITALKRKTEELSKQAEQNKHLVQQLVRQILENRQIQIGNQQRNLNQEENDQVISEESQRDLQLASQLSIIDQSSNEQSSGTGNIVLKITLIKSLFNEWSPINDPIQVCVQKLHETLMIQMRNGIFDPSSNMLHLSQGDEALGIIYQKLGSQEREVKGECWIKWDEISFRRKKSYIYTKEILMDGITNGCLIFSVETMKIID